LCGNDGSSSDLSFKKIVADYEKATGNTIDYSIVPYAPMRQKIVSAMTSGGVPNLFQNTPAEIIALHAWHDKLVDVSDVVETQREEYTETALLTGPLLHSGQGDAAGGRGEGVQAGRGDLRQISDHLRLRGGER
jgi:multiple sugar transport system substrate-binding protein